MSAANASAVQRTSLRPTSADLARHSPEAAQAAAELKLAAYDQRIRAAGGDDVLTPDEIEHYEFLQEQLGFIREHKTPKEG